MQSVSVVLTLLVFLIAFVTAYHRPNNYLHAKPHYDLNKAPALFQQFIKDYNRHYKDEEDYYLHYFAFFKTLVKINTLNDSDGSATYDITRFADLTKEEQQKMNGLIKPGNVLLSGKAN